MLSIRFNVFARSSLIAHTIDDTDDSMSSPSSASLAGAHLHGDHRAEDRLVGLVEHRDLDVDADRRVHRRDGEGKVVDRLLAGGQRARAAHQMVAGLVELRLQRVRHPRVAHLSVDDRAQRAGVVGRGELNLHVGGGALGDDARRHRAADDADRLREVGVAAACERERVEKDMRQTRPAWFGDAREDQRHLQRVFGENAVAATASRQTSSSERNMLELGIVLWLRRQGERLN